MKKTLIAIAALTCAAGAQAQSNVTLYGVLDHSVGYTSKVTTPTGENRQFALYPAGGLEGSRWGLRGSENLGAGLSAFFTLESGINIGNGRFAESGTLFNRQALVGLRSNRFGAVSLGRQSDMVVDFVAPMNQVARFARTIGGAPYDANNFDYSSQLQNSIKYVSPSFGGFQFGGAVSLSGVPGGTRDYMVWSAGAAYANGPLKLGAAYTDSKNANFNPILQNRLRTDNEGSNFAGLEGLVSSLVGKTRYRNASVGGAYSFGPATIAATYSNVRNSAIDVMNIPDIKAHIINVNGTYQLTSALGLGLGYTYARTNGTDEEGRKSKPQTHQITAGANYALSRRSEVYVTVAAQRGNDDASGAMINGLGSTTSKTQFTGRVGLRHAF